MINVSKSVHKSKPIGSGHFVGHLLYRLSDKTHIPQLNAQKIVLSRPMLDHKYETRTVIEDYILLQQRQIKAV